MAEQTSKTKSESARETADEICRRHWPPGAFGVSLMGDAIRSALLAREAEARAEAKGDEVAWLVAWIRPGVPPRWLGCSTRYGWTTPDGAIRFARKKDAEDAIHLLNEKWLIDASELRAEEHAWIQLDALAARGEEQNKDVRRPEQLPEAGSSGGCPVVPLAPPASPTPGDEARAKLMLDARHFLNERGVGLPAREWLLADFALVQLQPIRQVLAPVLSWYDGGGEIAEPPLSELVRLAVEDLVADRAQCLALRAELEQARQEREKYRYSAAQFCGAHIGTAMWGCPACERDEWKRKDGEAVSALRGARAELARERERAETAERLCIERIRAEVQERVNRWTKLMESAEFEDSRARRAAIVLELEELRHRISSVGFFAQAAPHATHALHRAARPGQVGTIAGIPIVADPSVPEGQMVARQHQPTDADVLEKAEKRCPECGRPWWSSILSRCPWSGHSRPPNPLRRPAGGGEGM